MGILSYICIDSENLSNANIAGKKSKRKRPFFTYEMRFLLGIQSIGCKGRIAKIFLWQGQLRVGIYLKNRIYTTVNWYRHNEKQY